MGSVGEKIKNILHRAKYRISAEKLPAGDEIDRFGADGEDTIYRILRENFSCVIRNVIVPHKDKYLEKDFLVVERGVPVVIEVKNWKGKIGVEPNGEFCQDKENGVHKTLKSPVGTTAQFIRVMKEFYGLDRWVCGMVVFAEPSCVLNLPESVDEILLVHAKNMVTAIKTEVKRQQKTKEKFPTDRILRCTRFYSQTREFCKGLIADQTIPCVEKNGDSVLLNPDYIKGIRVEHQPFFLRDKMYVIYTNNAEGIYYNHDATVTVCCLDGTAKKIALSKVTYILF